MVDQRTRLRGGWLEKILLTLLSAGLGVLVFEPFAWWLLALVAWVPLLFALKDATPRQGFYLGLLHGFLLFGGTLSWLWSIFGRVSIGLWGVLALFTAVTSLVVVCLPRRSHFVSAVLVASVWAGVEFYRAELFFLTFPWITPGTGFAPNWITPVMGVYGVTFVIIFSNALLVRSWKLALPILLVVAAAGLTFPQLSLPEETVRVGLVQDESGMIGKLRESSEALAMEVDAIVWPEYSLGTMSDAGLDAGLALAGNDRIFVASGLENRDGIVGNTAFTISKEGVIGRHIKNHPVHLFDDGVKGETAEPVETSYGKIGTPICFDCDHQDVLRKMTAEGAEFFLIPSLDRMDWTARQHEQHGALFRHRAAENGRWLAVASSSGVTQIIDPRGYVHARLPLMEKGTLVGEVARRDGWTFFQKGGWLIGPLAMFAAGGIVLWLAWRKLRRSDDCADSSGSKLESASKP